MKLISIITGKEIAEGSTVYLDDIPFRVTTARKPHKPNSEGKMTVMTSYGECCEFYVSVFGCEWIDREDRL